MAVKAELTKIPCPVCGRPLLYAKHVAGQIKCPHCKKIVNIEYDGQSEPHTSQLS